MQKKKGMIFPKESTINLHIVNVLLVCTKYSYMFMSNDNFVLI